MAETRKQAAQRRERLLNKMVAEFERLHLLTNPPNVHGGQGIRIAASAYADAKAALARHDARIIERRRRNAR